MFDFSGHVKASKAMFSVGLNTPGFHFLGFWGGWPNGSPALKVPWSRKALHGRSQCSMVPVHGYFRVALQLDKHKVVGCRSDVLSPQRGRSLLIFFSGKWFWLQILFCLVQPGGWLMTGFLKASSHAANRVRAKSMLSFVGQCIENMTLGTNILWEVMLSIVIVITRYGHKIMVAMWWWTPSILTIYSIDCLFQGKKSLCVLVPTMQNSLLLNFAWRNLSFSRRTEHSLSPKTLIFKEFSKSPFLEIKYEHDDLRYLVQTKKCSNQNKICSHGFILENNALIACLCPNQSRSMLNATYPHQNHPTFRATSLLNRHMTAERVCKR